MQKTKKAQVSENGKAQVSENGKAQVSENGKAQVNGFKTVKNGKLPIKIEGADIPELTYTFKGYTSEGKAIELYEAQVNGKRYILTSNFDSIYYGIDLPTVYEKAKKTEGAVIKVIAKGGKEAESAGYTEGADIDISNISVFTKRLLVYTKSLYIEVDNTVYLYIVRNKGAYKFSADKGFYIA